MKFKYDITKEIEIESKSLKEIVNKFFSEGTGILQINIDELDVLITLENKHDEANYTIEFEDSEIDWTGFSDYESDILEGIKSEFSDKEIKGVKSILIDL